MNYNINSTLQYTDQFEAHKYSVLGGFSIQRSENTFFSASGRGFPSDLVKTLNSAGTTTSPANPGTGTSFAFLGYLARANYSYLDRYL
ncbi:MAG: hypothetical protein MN733_09410, partial [Nitrososphaera sp.]|nr:hypothetical protein [Nitrososphaera sp.]